MQIGPLYDQSRSGLRTVRKSISVGTQVRLSSFYLWRRGTQAHASEGGNMLHSSLSAGTPKRVGTEFGYEPSYESNGSQSPGWARVRALQLYIETLRRLGSVGARWDRLRRLPHPIEIRS